jgi:hypothetical protein
MGGRFAGWNKLQDTGAGGRIAKSVGGVMTSFVVVLSLRNDVQHPGFISQASDPLGVR